MTPDELRRFLAKLDRADPAWPGCWTWTAARFTDDYRKVYDPATGKSSYKYTPRPAGQDDADQAAKWAYIAQLRWEDDADARGAAEASIKLALDAREAVLRAAARVE